MRFTSVFNKIRAGDGGKDMYYAVCIALSRIWGLELSSLLNFARPDDNLDCHKIADYTF